MKKIAIIGFIFLFVSSSTTLFSQVLKLNDVIALTVKNHPLIKQKQEQLKAAQYKVDQQESLYYPGVNAKASYTRIGPVPTLTFNGIKFDLAPADNYNMAVVVNQMVYDFGARNAGVEYVRSFLNMLRDNEDLIKMNLSSQVVDIFYGVLFIEHSMAVKDSQYAALQTHLQVTELKIKAGTATAYDKLSTETRLLQIQNEKLDLDNKKKNLQYRLKELIGYDPGKTVMLSGQFSLPVYQLNIDSLLQTAFKQRAELKMVNDQLNSGEKQMTMIDKSDNPRLLASAGFGYKNGYVPDLEELRANWFAGVSVEIPIYDGNRVGNKISEAQANLNAVRQEADQVKNRVSTEVYQAAGDFKNSLDKMELSKAQVKYAQNALDFAKIQYERGAATNLEVLDSETRLTEAKLFNLQATYNSIIHYYALKKAVGDRIYNN